MYPNGTHIDRCLQIFVDRFSIRQPWRKHRDVDKEEEGTCEGHW